MDPTQLADLGEFIGGVAVLATLINLAVQVRGGAREQRSTAAREATREMAAVYHSIVDSQEVAPIWLNHSYEDLNPTDRLRFSGLTGHFFRLRPQRRWLGRLPRALSWCCAHCVQRAKRFAEPMTGMARGKSRSGNRAPQKS